MELDGDATASEVEELAAMRVVDAEMMGVVCTGDSAVVISIEVMDVDVPTKAAAFNVSAVVAAQLLMSCVVDGKPTDSVLLKLSFVDVNAVNWTGKLENDSISLGCAVTVGEKPSSMVV